MSIVYSDNAHLDTGLEWGRMWHLQPALLNMPRRGLGAEMARVRPVLVARRRWRGNRVDGYVYRYFVRLPDREYEPTSYFTVVEGQWQASRCLFLTEHQAWEAYIATLAAHMQRLNDERALVDLEMARARLKARQAG